MRDAEVNKLEEVRKELGFSQEEFAAQIIQSRGCTKREFENYAKLLHTEYPNATAKEILAGVYAIREYEDHVEITAALGYVPSTSAQVHFRYERFRRDIKRAMEDFARLDTIEDPDKQPFDWKSASLEEHSKRDENRRLWEFKVAVGSANGIDDLVRYFYRPQKYIDGFRESPKTDSRIEAILGWYE